MPNNNHLPALCRQVSDLVLAGSTAHAEDAFSDAVEQFGDLVVVEVLGSLAPQVTALHLAAFDGGKPSLATLLVPPKVWAESLAFFAATWDEHLIEDDPERIAELLFAHIHGIVYSTDDENRRNELLTEASSTDWGVTAFAILFSLAPEEILELAARILKQGIYVTGQTTSDNDLVPLALDLARASEDGWNRALFELFPDFRHSEDLADAEFGENEDEEPLVMQRSTKELLNRLRRQVPSTRGTLQKAGSRKSLGADIFS